MAVRIPVMLLLALASSVATLAGCSSAAKQSLPPGLIAFSEAGDIWAVHPDGSGRKQLTRTPALDEDSPSWSPDGSQIAFQVRPHQAAGGATDSAHRDQQPAIDVMAVDASGRHTVTPVGGGNGPAWSPDGTRIAFSIRNRLMTVKPDGSGLTDLQVPGGCPVWSPDSSRIAFCDTGSGGSNTDDLYLMNADGSNVHPLTDDSAARLWPGAWSPDGRTIAFSSDRDGKVSIYSIGADGTGLRRLRGGPGTLSVTAWLADGRIVFSDSREDQPVSDWKLLQSDGSVELTLPGRFFEPVAYLPTAEERAKRAAALKRVPSQTSQAGTATERRQVIDMGDGHRMSVACRGTGSPAIVLDAGLGVASSTWLGVMNGAGSISQVCRYDRAGLGLSDRRLPPRTSSQMVEELRTLLQRADIKPPYVLVGASFGGLNVQLYQARYPQEVRGIVLVDSIHPDLDASIELVLTAPQAQERRAQLAQNGEGVSFNDLLASDALVKAAMRPTTIPIIVLRHGLPFQASADYPSAAVESLWKRLEEQLAARSMSGSVVVATRSHHRIAESEPDLVVAAIKKVIASTR